jgi:hypothetical protein
MNIELSDFTLRDDMSIIHWNFGAGWFSRMRNRDCQHRTAKYEFVDYEMKDLIGKTFIQSSEVGERRSVFEVGFGWVDLLHCIVL